ncbi:MAG TPA: hypothetical protein VG097_05785 [Gemmata sp.]|jgi:hypothetical protein|nr:hypothetical protein [Gemmata sp.]
MNPTQEFEELISGVLDGPPDTFRSGRLCELLRLYPALQNDYIEHVQLHALLIWREGRVVPTPVSANEPKIDNRGTPELSEVAPIPTPPAKRSFSKRGRWTAAAVLACVAFGLSVFAFLMLSPAREAEAGPEVVEQLVGWNLDIAQAQTHDERRSIFDTRAESMKGLLKTSRLSQEDRELGQSLVDNGAWLTDNDDPMAEAERFGEIADKLLARLDTATGTNDNKRIIKYADSYSRLTEFGVSMNLERAMAKLPHDPKRKNKIDHLIAGDASRARKLDDMLERHPDSSTKALHRARKAHSRKHNNGSK